MPDIFIITDMRLKCKVNVYRVFNRFEVVDAIPSARKSDKPKYMRYSIGRIILF